MIIFYDGECPVCSHYARYTRLQENVSSLSLVNLREEPGKVTEFNESGLNVDHGMIVHFKDATYHGADAMHVLALLSAPVGFFNRCNRFIFSRPRLARLIYPVLVLGRNTLLRLLGRKKINAGRAG